MKKLLILGGGTAGTMMANSLVDRLGTEWQVTVVEPDRHHVYQPGLLFLPFGMLDDRKLTRPRNHTFKRGVQWKPLAIRQMDHAKKSVVLDDDSVLEYDLAILASGTRIRPDMTPGLEDGPIAGVHDFYTVRGAQALRSALANFKGGRLVVNVVEMPIKCPVAPLEFLFWRMIILNDAVCEMTWNSSTPHHWMRRSQNLMLPKRWATCWKKKISVWKPSL